MKRGPANALLAFSLAAVLTGCGGAGDADSGWTEFGLDAALSTNSILIGQPVILTVTADHQPDTRVEWPALAEGDPPPLVIRSQSATTNLVAEGQAETLASYTLTSFQVGEHVISSNFVHFLRGGELVYSNVFPFAAVRVESLLSEDGRELAGDKDLLSFPPGVPRWLIGILAVALLAFAIAGLVVWVIVKRGPRFRPPPPLPPPHITALEAIDRLKRKQYIENRQLEPFYVELSDIVRRYIEQRFRIHAPEQTTDEFMVSATHSRLLSTAHRALTREFLVQCDMVKFARAEPDEDAMQGALQAAEGLIHETRETTTEAAA